MDEHLMEVEKKPHTRCPYCKNLVPVLEKDGFAHIAGHYNSVTESVQETERRSQRGGPDIRSFRTVEKQVDKYCGGGSFRIIGRTTDEEPELQIPPPKEERIPRRIVLTSRRFGS